jgi:hypothetical protein
MECSFSGGTGGGPVPTVALALFRLGSGLCSLAGSGRAHSVIETAATHRNEALPGRAENLVTAKVAAPERGGGTRLNGAAGRAQ